MGLIEPKISERGSALVEQIIALTILISSFSFAIRAIIDISRVQARQRVGGLLFENDQLIRYEITGLLRTLQRRITEQSTAVQCVAPGIGNMYRQIAFERCVTQTLVFGVPSEMANLPTGSFAKTVFNSIYKLRMAAANKDVLSQSTKDRKSVV